MRRFFVTSAEIVTLRVCENEGIVRKTGLFEREVNEQLESSRFLKVYLRTVKLKTKLETLGIYSNRKIN